MLSGAFVCYDTRMSYIVRLDVFEGPFDLLVYLIEHARMSVYDIRISEITAQYLEYVSDMKNARFELAQEFMVLAAELIDIKSRMLIPSETIDPETGEPEDPRKALVQRILEYKRFKEAASMLQEREELMQHVRFKPQEDLSAWTGEEDELLKSSTEQFVAAFEAFLLRRRRLDEMRRTYERARRDRQSIEERSVQIRTMLRGRKSMMFSEMIESDPSVYGRVITFMSLLELLSEGRIDAEQRERYSDIRVIPKNIPAEDEI